MPPPPLPPPSRPLLPPANEAESASSRPSTSSVEGEEEEEAEEEDRGAEGALVGKSSGNASCSVLAWMESSPVKQNSTVDVHVKSSCSKRTRCGPFVVRQR